MSWTASTILHSPKKRSQEDYIRSITNVNAINKVKYNNTYNNKYSNKEQKGYEQYELRCKRQECHLQQLQRNEQQKWFGDKLVFEDKWISGEYNEIFCVGSVNINRICKYLDWIEWDNIFQTLSNLQLNMFGITGPNVNFNNK
jgi:hypothetical protein